MTRRRQILSILLSFLAIEGVPAGPNGAAKPRSEPLTSSFARV